MVGRNCSTAKDDVIMFDNDFFGISDTEEHILAMVLHRFNAFKKALCKLV